MSDGDEDKENEFVDKGAPREDEAEAIVEFIELAKALVDQEPTPENEHLRTEYARRYSDPQFAVKFLRLAYDKPPDAVKKFEVCLKWRMEKQVDKCLETCHYPLYDKIKKDFVWAFHGVDKQDRPIYIDCAGMLNLPSVVETTTIEHLVEMHITSQEYMVERLMKQQTEKIGRKIHQITVIVDLTGLGTAQANMFAYNYLRLSSEVDQEYYPEAMAQLFVINAPWVFTMCWRMIRTFLNQRTKDKIQIHGGDYAEALEEVIDSDQLPSFLGGTCECTRENWPGCHPFETEYRDMVMRLDKDSDNKNLEEGDQVLVIDSNGKP